MKNSLGDECPMRYHTPWLFVVATYFWRIKYENTRRRCMGIGETPEY
jgi:hypothetical protein